MAQTALICDDAMYMRVLIADILRQAGYEVVGEATNGEEAVEQYQAVQPDFVTMDIVMPGMSGVDALREIVKVDPKARILMCTALGQEALVAEAKHAGAVGFLVKPFEPTDLIEAVIAVL